MGYQICPECYRQDSSRGDLLQLPTAEERHHQQVCKICSAGVCAKCQDCNQPGKLSCDACTMNSGKHDEQRLWRRGLIPTEIARWHLPLKDCCVYRLGYRKTLS